MGELLAAVWNCPKPVLVRVAGPARAGGLGLIAAADLAVCATTATFAFSEVRLGIVPAVISATVLPRLSARAAAELYLTGDTFAGVRAEQIGLVTRAVAPDDLDRTVDDYTASLLRGAPGALATAKALARRAAAGPEPAELAYLTELSVGFFTSPEGREGVRSFVEKRPAAWVPPGIAERRS
jgi:methylglutaconyl-CoA hydratase